MGVGEDVAVRTFVIVDVGLDEGVFVLDTVGVCNAVDVAERLGVRVVDAGKWKQNMKIPKYIGEIKLQKTCINNKKKRETSRVIAVIQAATTPGLE